MTEDSYRSLLKQFESTKQELGDTENSIRRITGRNPDEIIRNNVGGKFRPNNAFSINERKIFYSAREKRKRMEQTAEGSPPTDHAKESEGESSPDESPVKKPAIASTVVAKSHAKSRKATIAEQNVNSKQKARNKRIFQVLIGTLQKFETEEKKEERKHLVSMRAEIEKKVDAITEEQRQELKKEKKTLFETRKLKLIQLRCLEKKIERAESHEVFENVQKKLCNFIKTKAKPHVYFLPAKHTSATRQRLEESKQLTLDLIKKKRAELEADLAEIEESYRRDPEQSTAVSDDVRMQNLDDSNNMDLGSKTEKYRDFHDASFKFPAIELDENSAEAALSGNKDVAEEDRFKNEIKSFDAARLESGKVATEHPGLEDSRRISDKGDGTLKAAKGPPNAARRKSGSAAMEHTDSDSDSSPEDRRPNSDDGDSSGKDENESPDAAGNEPKRAAIKRYGSGHGGKGSAFERNLADSISDQEFEPIYD